MKNTALFHTGRKNRRNAPILIGLSSLMVISLAVVTADEPKKGTEENQPLDAAAASTCARPCPCPCPCPCTTAGAGAGAAAGADLTLLSTAAVAAVSVAVAVSVRAGAVGGCSRDGDGIRVLMTCGNEA